MAKDDDEEISPEDRALLLKSLDDVVTYLTVNRKALGKIADSRMFLADLRTKMRAAQTMLDGVCEKSYVARERIEETNPGLRMY